MQDATSFLRQRFCSLRCSNSRSKGGISRKAFHYQARKMRGPECECCGTTKSLHAHHIDEDWTNNSPGNIQTLCVFCHQFWHAMHRRRGAKPFAPMPDARFFMILPRTDRADTPEETGIGKWRPTG